MDPLAVALALICAWSQPHCATLSIIPISQGDTLANNRAFAVTHIRNGRFVDVVVSDQLTHPVAIAVSLAYEATEIREGPPPNGKDCGSYEGYSGQQAFYHWFISTFGPPVTALGSQDGLVLFLSVPERHPPHPCT